MRWTSALLLFVSCSFASVREELAPVVDLAPSDTIVAIHPAGEGRIQVDLRSGAQTRTLQLSVASGLREKVLASAELEGIKSDVVQAGQPTAAATEGDQARNRTSFNRLQGGAGAAVFYVTVGLGLQPTSGSVATGLVLLGYPASYLGHYIYSKDKEWTDAHLAGTSYASNTLYASALVGTGFLLGFDEPDAWRIAAFSGALAYPAGLGLGYHYGDRHRAEPGRVYLAQSMANQGMFTGALVPLALAPSDGMDKSDVRNLFRTAAIASVAGGVGGHLLGDRLFGDRPVSGGLGLGVTTLANLGLLSGFELVMLTKPSSPTSFFGLLLAGNTAGTLAGLKLLPERRDTRERSIYIGSGTSLGALTGLALLIMKSPEDLSPGQITAFPTLGAWGGYLLTTALTEDLVEPNHPQKARRSHGVVGDFAFSPLVVPIPSEDGTRWAWPGLTLSLR